MAHGYTNDTTGDGVVVVKRYAGPDAEVRCLRETSVLGRLQGLLPVPPVLDDFGDVADVALTLGFVSGFHGQDLIDSGRAAEVLHACGRILARIHALHVTEVLAGARPQVGEVLVHGDFGPNNLLFRVGGSGEPEVAGPSATEEPVEFTAVLDWEWAHVGQRIEDLAWCEWIVRMHHPEQAGALDDFFAAYGARPAWADRQAAMLARCQGLIDFTELWEPGGAGVRQWQSRAEITAAWSE